MKNSTYSFTLDLQTIQTQVSLSVKHGDTARSLYITLTDSGTPVSLEPGTYAMFSAQKPDGTSLTNGCVVDFATSVIKYDFTEQTTNVQGIVQCEIIIYSPQGRVIGSPRFEIAVDERIGADVIASASENTFIDNMGVKATAWESAEATRVQNEATRLLNEEARKEAEQTRISQESQRVKAEELRATNEATRVEAEKTRTTFIPSISEDGVLSWSNDKGLTNPEPLPLVSKITEIILNTVPYAEEVKV